MLQRGDTRPIGMVVSHIFKINSHRTAGEIFKKFPKYPIVKLTVCTTRKVSYRAFQRMVISVAKEQFFYKLWEILGEKPSSLLNDFILNFRLCTCS
jgi:hypothetical protein